MNKSFKYTLLTILLAVVLAFGSMVGMNFILRIRERQFLTEGGKVVMETPVRNWPEEGKEEQAENSAKEKYIFATEQMEEIIACWNERSGVISHDPVTGQVSMEEAIEAGEEWIAKMGMEENGKKNGAEQYAINATLGIAAKQISTGVPVEPYYSFWTVQFSGQSMSAVLYLNAITGKVWSAEITLFEDIPKAFPHENLTLFVELSGLHTDADVIRDMEGTKAILSVDNSRLWAEAEMFYKEKVIMIYKFTIGEKY